jgi:hypothetical protein
VDIAKQYLKHAPGVEAEALAVRAYAARIAALQASGMHREAQALGALVSERFPAHQAQMAALMQQSDVATGNFESLLASLLHADPQRRRDIEAMLARRLTDPALLAASPALPPDHPLKRAAGVASDLFTAVTSGPLPPGALAALDVIARQSPLAPWKLLIRALEAFYRGADDAVLANLAAIPADSVPGRLVPVLRRLVEGDDPSAARAVAVTTLIEQVSGRRPALQTQLTQLSNALAARDERRALAAVQALLVLLRSAPVAVRRTFVASVLHHWHRHNFSPQPLLRLLPSMKHDPDILRLLALTVERRAWDEAVELWEKYVHAATRAGILPAKGPEMARVLLHMANLFPADPDEVLDTLGVDSEQELRQYIRASDMPMCFDRAALLERALKADPTPSVFRALVDHYDRRGEAKRAEVEAEAWHQAHAHDLEPLLYLIRAAERRGAVRKALNLLAAAEALDRVHPEVRQSRFRLLLTGAERRIKEGKAALALEDLEQLAQEPRTSEGDHRVYVLALSWVAAQQRADATATAHYEQLLSTTAANPVLQSLVLEAIGTALKVQLPRTPLAAASPEQTLAGLARACDLFRALDRPLAVPTTLYKQVEPHLQQASAAQLHSLCAGGLWMQRPALTYRASGYGLALHDPLAYRFLLARGRALSTALHHDAPERARLCLRAARELASRVRDMEAVREASEALATIPSWGLLEAMITGTLSPPEEEALTQEDIARIIEDERQSRTTPQFPAVSSIRKRRQGSTRRQRRQRRMFDDLFSMLPFKDLF